MPYKQIESTHDWDGVSHTYPDPHEGRLPPELKNHSGAAFWLESKPYFLLETHNEQ